MCQDDPDESRTRVSHIGRLLTLIEPGLPTAPSQPSDLRSIFQSAVSWVRLVSFILSHSPPPLPTRRNPKHKHALLQIEHVQGVVLIDLVVSAASPHLRVTLRLVVLQISPVQSKLPGRTFSPLPAPTFAQSTHAPLRSLCTRSPTRSPSFARTPRQAQRPQKSPRRVPRNLTSRRTRRQWPRSSGCSALAVACPTSPCVKPSWPFR